MTVQASGFTAGRVRFLTAQQRTDEAKQARREERTKALWYLQRTGQMEIAYALGLSVGPSLLPMWRDALDD